MLFRLIVKTALMAAAVWAMFAIVPGLDWNEEWLTLVVIALIIGVVNALIRPVARLLTVPIRLMTLGLFSLVLNVLLMAGVIWLTQELDLGVTSTGAAATFTGAVILAIAGAILSLIGD